MTRLVMICWLGCALLALADPYLSGKSDKNPLLYRCGEEMIFTVSLLEDGQPLPGRQLSWEIKGDDGATQSGKANSDSPLALRATASKPGFVRVTVSLLDDAGNVQKNGAGRSIKFDGGAGAEVSAIPLPAEPADFDAFWQQLRAAADVVALEPRLEKVPSTKADYVVYKFAIPLGEGLRPATGYLLMPPEKKDLNLRVTFDGYGIGKTRIRHDYARPDGILFHITRHGEDPFGDAEYFEQESKDLKGFGWSKNTDPKESYFYQLVLRDLVGLRYAMSLPEWNKQELLLMSGSMGAFQAVACASVTPEVTQLSISYPWLSDNSGHALYSRMGGWSPGYRVGLAYYDPVFLAKRCQCPLALTSLLGDYVCPPSGQTLVFRNYAGPKTWTVIQNGGHGARYEPKPVQYTFKDEIR